MEHIFGYNSMSGDFYSAFPALNYIDEEAEFFGMMATAKCQQDCLETELKHEILIISED